MLSDLDSTVVDGLVCALERATGGTVATRHAAVPFGMRHRLDLLLALSTDDGPLGIAVEMLRQGYPRDVRQALWQLDEYTLSRPDDGAALVQIVAADHLSAGAREALRKRGVGYFDSSGSLFFKHGRWLIDIERPAKPGVQQRTASALFTGARERVVHTLLTHAGEWLTGGDVAERAATSTYTCSLVLQELQNREWLESTGAGRTQRRRLSDPGALLDAWAQAWLKRKDKRSRWYVFPRNPRALLEQLACALEAAQDATPWAFTGTAAANGLSPLLTSVDTADVIIPPGTAERFAAWMKLASADKGANVTLIERSGAGELFRMKQPDGPAWFASPFIQYLDLQDGRGRNRELAEQLRRDILKV